jgi:hypothetical protein
MGGACNMRGENKKYVVCHVDRKIRKEYNFQGSGIDEETL